MKVKRMNHFAIVLITASISCCPALAAEEPEGPTTYQILDQLLAHSGMKIDKQQYCDSMLSDSENRTLGKYIARQMSYMDEGENQVVSECKADKGGWTCDIQFMHRVPGKEASSSYGVRVLADRKGVLNLKSLSCIGTG